MDEDKVKQNRLTHFDEKKERDVIFIKNEFI